MRFDLETNYNVRVYFTKYKFSGYVRVFTFIGVNYINYIKLIPSYYFNRFRSLILSSYSVQLLEYSRYLCTSNTRFEKDNS